MRQSSKESTGSSDSDSSSDDESTQTGATNVPTAGALQPEKVNHQKESEAGAEISALVNYVQPIHFTSFEVSESKYIKSCTIKANNGNQNTNNNKNNTIQRLIL